MGIRIPCLRCGKYEGGCACPPLPPEPEEPAPKLPEAPPEKKKLRAETIKLRREKRPGGREVVILEGFPRDVDLEGLSRDLKRACGTGGTAKDGAIELQGDHRERIARELLERGFRSVRAGG